MNAAANRRAVARGAFVGLSIIVPITIVRVIVDRRVDDFDHSGWVVVFSILILVPFYVAGFVAGRTSGDGTTPLTNGVLGAVGALVLWIPVRLLIWVIREDDRGFVAGHKPVLPIGQLFLTIVFAAFLGMVGAWLATRRRGRP